jgi:hypothetical protein
MRRELVLVMVFTLGLGCSESAPEGSGDPGSGASGPAGSGSAGTGGAGAGGSSAGSGGQGTGGGAPQSFWRIEEPADSQRA